MRKRKILFFCIILTLFCCSCQKDKNQEFDMAKWKENATLNVKETPQELYEKALKEDTLVIYSETSRVMDVKKSFEKEYPGLTVYVNDVRGNDLLKMLNSNFETRDYACDIVLCGNNNGQITNELLPKGIVCKYVPFDMKDKFYSNCNQEALTLMGEVEQVFYNANLYKKAPISNWWELTEEKYRGKVVINNPFKSLSQMGLFCMMIKESEQMREAYYELYGKEIELKEGENVGETFIRMLVKNDAILVNTNTEIVNLIGDENQTEATIGIMISSKIRMRELGYSIAPINELKPFVGTYSPNSIMIAGGSKNINTAKLFIRWIYGEADGQGEGYKPYLTEGTWSARRDVQSASEISLEDMNIIDLDTNYIYKSQKKFEKYWLSLLDDNK